MMKNLYRRELSVVLFFAVSVWFGCFVSAGGGFHNFTNAKGQVITAKIQAVEKSGKVSILSKKGRRFTVDPAIFSEADRKYIRDWAAAKASAGEQPKGKEVLVGVGYGGRRILSEDGGKTWEITEEWMENGRDDKFNIMGLVYAKGKFICVGGGGGGGGAGGHIHLSTDGRSWKKIMDGKNRINPIVFGNGRFLVGGPNRQQLMFSEEGEKWTEGATITDHKATHWRKAAFGNGVFVFSGNNGGHSPPWLITTKDGSTIDSFSDEIPSVSGLAFGNGRFVVVGQNGVRRSSADGIKWKNHDTEDDLRWLVFDGEKFLCGGKTVSQSTDGMKWEDVPNLRLGNVKWSDGKRLITHGWPGKMSFSHDGGKTFSRANTMTANGINAVVRGYVPE